MPYNPQIATSRGAAGESDDTTAGRYNFANLYQLNRNDGADQKKDLAGFQDRAAKIGGEDDRGNATGLYGEAKDAIRGNDQATADTKIGKAVDLAKGLASDTQGYSVSGSLKKKGITGAQNAAATFYAGTSGQDAAAQARQYGNIYKSMQNAQAGITGRVDKQLASKNATDPSQAGPMADKSTPKGPVFGVDQIDSGETTAGGDPEAWFQGWGKGPAFGSSQPQYDLSDEKRIGGMDASQVDTTATTMESKYGIPRKTALKFFMDASRSPELNTKILRLYQQVQSDFGVSGSGDEFQRQLSLLIRQYNARPGDNMPAPQAGSSNSGGLQSTSTRNP